MLKIPGEGKPFSRFSYDITDDGSDKVRIDISYSKTTSSGSDENGRRAYEVRPDIRSGKIGPTKEAIKNELSAAYNKTVKITEDKVREYITIGNKQFTGRRVDS